MTAWAAILVLTAATLLGIIATLLAKKDPGAILGVVIILGTIAAGLGVRYNSAYVLIPAPTLAYVVGAMISGYIHDRSLITGRLELGLHAGEWVGAGFLWMTAGTIVAILVAAGRWAWARRDLWLYHGRTPAPAGGRPRDENGGFREPTRSGRPGYRGGPPAASAPAAAAPAAPAPGGGRASAYPARGGMDRPARGGEPTRGADPARSSEPVRGGEPRRGAPPAAGPEPDPYARYYDDDTWR